MARFLLRLELTLNNLLDEIEKGVVEAVEREYKISLHRSCRDDIRKVVRDVLTQDIVQSDTCGFSILCHENVAEYKAPDFNLKSDEDISKSEEKKSP